VYGSLKLAAPLAAALAVAARNAGGSSNIPALTPSCVNPANFAKPGVTHVASSGDYGYGIQAPVAAERGSFGHYEGNYSAPAGRGTPNGINAF
jgi:hypothetical protein